MTGRRRKILTLGSTGFGRAVESFAWDQIPAEFNVADYDVVILDFTPFEDDDRLRTGIALDRLPRQAAFARLLFSGASVAAIGVPDTVLGNDESVTGSVGATRAPVEFAFSLPVTWWFPAPIRVVRVAGDVRNVVWGWDSYFELVPRYTWHFDHVETGYMKPLYPLTPAHPESDWMRVDAEALAATRFDAAVGIKFELYAANSRIQYDYGRYHHYLASGAIFWLPRPATASAAEGIALLLREQFEVSAQAPRPAWVEGFRLPSEVPLREEATRQLDAAQAAYEAYRTATAEAEHEARFASLLYETGDEALEPVVRDALRALGANVDEPAERGREDGRFQYGEGSERRAMLEIKGRKGTLKLSDVRELDQWVRDALLDWDSKGVLIANLQSEQPPSERRDVFPSNCVRLAQRTGIALLTTTQLYEALRRHQNGQLDVDGFFDEVFSTAGVCDLPEPPAPPAPSEATSSE